MSQPRADEHLTVVLADDHPALLIGLRALLEAAGIAVVATAADGRAALDAIAATQPTVAVVDCQLPVVSGPAVAAAVCRQAWRTRVIALSAYRDEHWVRAMVAAGVAGYLVKDEAPAAIAAAVRAAARGERWFSPSVAAWVAWPPGRSPASPGGLSDRERAVLHLIVRGQTNKEIARRLNIVERTVEFHVGNVLRKLNLASRVEAAVWASAYLPDES